MTTTTKERRSKCPDCGMGPYTATFLQGRHKRECGRNNEEIENGHYHIPDFTNPGLKAHHLHITGGSVDNRNVQFVEQCCHCGERKKVPYIVSEEVEAGCGNRLANRMFVRQDPWGDEECPESR